MTADTSTPLVFGPCPHRNIVSATTGGMHYAEGEVWDDVTERLLCLDCLEYLTERQVRARWDGSLSAGPDPDGEEDDDVPF